MPEGGKFSSAICFFNFHCFQAISIRIQEVQWWPISSSELLRPMQFLSRNDVNVGDDLNSRGQI